MQIPPLKKSTFYLVSGATFLIGIVLGTLLLAGYLYANREAFFMLGQPVRIDTNLPPQFIEKATALTPGMVLFGKVSAKEAGQFIIETTVSNPLDPMNSTTAMVRIPFNAQKDEVEVFMADSTKSTGSLDDISVGAHLYVQILQDKKIIYLLPTR